MNAVLRAALARCARCNDTGEIEHEQMGLIACPQCSHPPRKDKAKVVIAALNAVEHRRVEEARRRIDAAVRLAILKAQGRSVRIVIQDARLRTVDRIMRRWAVGHGNMGPPPEDAEARPPELDPDTMRVIDDIVGKRGPAPWQIRYHVYSWYRTETPCHLIAESLGKSEDTVYRYHEVVLEWLRCMFVASEHMTLVNMLKMVES